MPRAFGSVSKIRPENRKPSKQKNHTHNTNKSGSKKSPFLIHEEIVLGCSDLILLCWILANPDSYNFPKYFLQYILVHVCVWVWEYTRCIVGVHVSVCGCGSTPDVLLVYM